jgi:hypothetical protein
MVIELRKKGHPKTAKTGIEVFKDCEVYDFVDPNKAEAWNGFVYERGILYKTKFTYTTERGVSDSVEMEYYEKLIAHSIPIAFIAEGFHSYNNIEMYPRNIGKDSLYHKYLIPKGSKYYENDAGCVVSDAIIFI